MKKLFSTPLRAVISTICILLILCIIAAIIAFFALKNTLIGKDEARDIALEDAGFSRSDTSRLRTSLDYDDGYFEYDVDFYVDGIEYEYVIDGEDGGIIKRDIDGKRQNAAPNVSTTTPEQEAAPTETTTETSAEATTPQATTAPQAVPTGTETTAETLAETTTTAAATGITEDDAKDIAVKDAGVDAAAVMFTKVKVDYEDGIKIYEVDFYTADAEYDYEIAVADGSVVKKSHETVAGGTPNKGDYIGSDRAEEIALADASLTAADVKFSKRTELDIDDGRAEYEVEFYVGSTEYDYKIDAVSGAVIEKETDNDFH